VNRSRVLFQFARIRTLLGPRNRPIVRGCRPRLTTTSTESPEDYSEDAGGATGEASSQIRPAGGSQRRVHPFFVIDLFGVLGAARNGAIWGGIRQRQCRRRRQMHGRGRAKRFFSSLYILRLFQQGCKSGRRSDLKRSILNPVSEESSPCLVLAVVAASAIFRSSLPSSARTRASAANPYASASGALNIISATSTPIRYYAQVVGDHQKKRPCQ